MHRRSFSIGIALAIASGPLCARQELHKYLPDDGAAHDQFGECVALDGDLAIFGAPGADSQLSGTGAVYVFNAYSGEQLLKIEPPDANIGHFFGWDVALHEGIALIAATGDDQLADSAGSAYLFDATSGALFRKLLASDGEYSDSFGMSVDLDSAHAAIGASGDDDLGQGAGAAYVFDMITGQELHKLHASDGGLLDTFGISVSVWNGLVLVGASDHTHNGLKTGAAYLFDATTGQQLHELTPSDGEYNDDFGFSVSLDDGLAIVGAVFDDDAGTGSGSAYVFDAISGQQLYKLTASDAATTAYFGSGVELSGGIALIGAAGHVEGGVRSGCAYLFEAISGVELGKLLPSDGAQDDFFGYRNSLALDLDRALVGSQWDGDNGSKSGSAYVFGLGDPGSVFCVGEPGSGTACPCNNDNDGSVPGSGCANGASPSGAKLSATGAPTVNASSIALSTTGLVPGGLCVHFQGDDALNAGSGLAFGDGLRCVGGNAVIRLETTLANGLGVALTTVSIPSVGGVSAGETKRYQTWYKDTSGGQPCGVGVNDFNLSNGLELRWYP